MIPPLPGNSLLPNKVILLRPGWVTMAPITPPIIGIPPNSLAVLIPTNRFIPQNTALPAMASICTTAFLAKAGSILIIMFNNPVSKPQPIKPGTKGIKILAIFLRASLKGVAFLALMEACRALPSPTPKSAGCTVACSVKTAGFSSICLNSSVTARASPGPNTICTSGPALFTPFTPAIFFNCPSV